MGSSGGAVAVCQSGLSGNYSAAVACCAGIQSFSDGGCVCSACDASCSAVVTMAKAGLHTLTLLATTHRKPFRV